MPDTDSPILLEDYRLCPGCNGETHRDDLRGPHCKWCAAELGGEG